LALAVVLAFAACTNGGGPPTSTDPPGTVVVGSFDFSESEVLAQVYAQALGAKDIPVRLELNLGPRELVEPALLRGLVHLVPEYQGSAVDFLAGGGATDDPKATHESLDKALAGTSAAALQSAAAEDANAFAVTRATADRYGLRNISDLKPVSRRLVMGGSPECPDRSLCLRGLQDVYGLRFRDFYPLDAGGPLTVAALAGGDVDVALVFSSDPVVAARGFVLLQDDRGLEPAENVTPIVSRSMLARHGDRLRGALDAVSAALTTDQLIGMNRAVARGRSAAKVAESWLIGQGLA
jgi:osmoprotectant transport system substrate-binding protein